jgi:phage gpG-like protein
MIEIDMDPDEEMALLSVAIKKFGNFREPMREWVRYMQNETKKLFSNNALGGEYDGIQWEYFSEKTLARLSKGLTVYRFTRPKYRTKLEFGDRILQHTGKLRKSLTTSKLFRLTNNRVEFGSDVDYAGYHQFGTKNMPARPILSATNRNYEHLDRLISKHLTRSMGKRKNG